VNSSKNAATSFTKSTCLSACPCTKIWELQNTFPLNLIIAQFYCSHFPILAKIKQNNHDCMKIYMCFSIHPEHILLYIHQNEKNPIEVVEINETHTLQQHTHVSFSRFCSRAVEVSILLGHGATSLGDWYPKFWDSVVPHLRGSNVKSWRWDNYPVSKCWAPIT
jgi:hypothetical protein